MRADCRGGRRPVRVTLAVPSMTELGALEAQIRSVARAALLVRTSAGRGEHSHGLILVDEEELGALAPLCSPPAVRLDVVTGWPGHPAQLDRGLRAILAYDLRTGSREPGQEVPLGIIGTGAWEPLGARLQRWNLERAAAADRLCRCGCGRIVPAGRRAYACDGCAARKRQRDAREGRKRAAARNGAQRGATGRDDLDDLIEHARCLLEGLERIRRERGK